MWLAYDPELYFQVEKNTMKTQGIFLTSVLTWTLQYLLMFLTLFRQSFSFAWFPLRYQMYMTSHFLNVKTLKRKKDRLTRTGVFHLKCGVDIVVTFFWLHWFSCLCVFLQVKASRSYILSSVSLGQVQVVLPVWLHAPGWPAPPGGLVWRNALLSSSGSSVVSMTSKASLMTLLLDQTTYSSV